MGLNTDLFSSSHGPGLIGLLLGMFVLAAFCGLGMLVFDGRFNGDFSTSAAEQVADQAARINHLEAREAELEEEFAESKARKKIRGEIAQVRRLLARKQEVSGGLSDELAAARGGLAEARGAWEDYKNQYRSAARRGAVGEVLEELKTRDGRVFNKVTIRKVDDLEMRISHQNGLTTVGWQDLPPELQDRFQFDEKQAEEAAALVKEASDARSVSAARGSTRQEVERLKGYIHEKKYAIEKKDREIKANLGSIASSDVAIAKLLDMAEETHRKHRAALSAGRRSSHKATAMRYERQAESKEKANRAKLKRNREIDHRKKLWSAAIGRHFDEVRTVGGKLYRDVTLRNVSPLEVKISHESGTATLAVTELPREFCDEFLLSPAEAQKALDAEDEARRERRQALEELRQAEKEKELAKSRKRPATRPRPGPKAEDQDPEFAEEIASLRREAIELHAKLTTLSAEIMEARMKASGKQRSPPGSLETWEQRAMRLARIEGRMVAHLTDVENRLWALDPRYRAPIP